MDNIKKIKQQIKMVKLEKKGTKLKTKERREINNKLRKLYKNLMDLYSCSDKKSDLIKKIYKIEPNLIKLKIDLRKYTETELEFHYKKITGKKFDFFRKI